VIFCSRIEGQCERRCDHLSTLNLNHKAHETLAKQGFRCSHSLARSRSPGGDVTSSTSDAVDLYALARHQVNSGAVLSKIQANRKESDPDVPAWILRVRKLCAERGWTNRELADRTGLTPGWVSMTINHGKRGAQPRRDTLVRLAQVFNEPVGLWLKLGGLAAEEHEFNVERPSLIEFIDSEPTLTDMQKQILKATVMSWVSPTTSGRDNHVRRTAKKRTP
jgi:transcriptional regulator with XRE-family HTH domain